MLRPVRVCSVFWIASAAVTLLPAAHAYQPLKGVTVSPVNKETGKAETGAVVDIGEWMSSSNGGGGGAPSRNMVVFGTYAADFNTIEYGQRLRYYWPKLQQDKGIGKCAFLFNCQPAAAVSLAKLVDLPEDIDIWVDNTGEAARRFGVQRGWLPENEDVSPFLKLFGMLWGIGAWATLPAVIGGYIGNPFTPQPWIEDALAVGQDKGRWPDNALDISADGSVVQNKFEELPVVGSWPRRPLELATLRLQSMLGISLSHWSELAPDEEALKAGVLTQLGGCIIVEDNDKVVYEWKDPGICAVANFEDILK